MSFWDRVDSFFSAPPEQRVPGMASGNVTINMPPGVSLQEPGSRDVPGVRPTNSTTGADGGNTPPSGFSISELNLLARARAMVLGRRGLPPVLGTPEQDRAWDDYLIDADGTITPRMFQRLVLSAFVLTGEAWVWEQAPGLHLPLPAPTEIRRRGGTGPVYEYRWQGWTFPGGAERGVLPADQVTHYVMKEYITQTRGIGRSRYLKTIDTARSNYAEATVNRETILAAMHVVLRSEATNLDVEDSSEELAEGQEPTKPTDGEITIDVKQSRLWEIGQNDSLEVNRASAPPVMPKDLDRFLMAYMSGVYGLSGLALTGDASDYNFTSARYSNEFDGRVWADYQEMVIRATLPIWDGWVGRTGDAPEWNFPPPISVDPTKQAGAYRLLLEAEVVSKAWVQSQLGLNPGRMQAEIEEERRNRNGGNEQPAD